MRRTTALLLLSLSAASAFAQQTVPFHPGKSTAEGVAASKCALREAGLPQDTIVIAAGAYSGRPSGFSIDDSSHEASQFDVAVHSDKPVALLLSAYEPAIWNIGWTKDTKVVAVFTTGYHRQVVSGLPSGTPTATSTYTGKEGCGYKYISNISDLAWLNPKAQEIFKRNVTRVYAEPDKEGVIDIVESAKPKTDYVTSTDVRPESFKDPNKPLAGKNGLLEAVAKGRIRPATQADIEGVKKHYEALEAKKQAIKPASPPLAGNADSKPRVRTPFLSVHGTYVVLNDFIYPAGLTAVNHSTFIVPKGTKLPTGNPGLSVVLDLNRADPCATVVCR